MIRYLYGDSLGNFPALRDSMFRDRADQFHTRLGWQVSVDQDGFERDEYDDENPLYVIWERPDGRHGGSMRFLPTTGPVMVNDHFGHLTDGVEIRSPLIWECTRFCLSGDGAGNPRVPAALMMAGAEIGQGFHLRHAVGVFDARMIRIYRKLGWSPEVLGTDGTGRGAISVGLWEFSEPVLSHMAGEAGISRALSQLWFDRSFGGKAAPLAATG